MRWRAPATGLYSTIRSVVGWPLNGPSTPQSDLPLLCAGSRHPLQRPQKQSLTFEHGTLSGVDFCSCGYPQCDFLISNKFFDETYLEFLASSMGVIFTSLITEAFTMDYDGLLFFPYAIFQLNNTLRLRSLNICRGIGPWARGSGVGLEIRLTVVDIKLVCTYMLLPVSCGLSGL